MPDYHHYTRNGYAIRERSVRNWLTIEVEIEGRFVLIASAPKKAATTTLHEFLKIMPK